MPPARSNGNIITGEGVGAPTPPKKRATVRELRNPLDTGTSVPPEERFISMSVTRNPTGASIVTHKQTLQPRESMVIADIPGALPRGLPKHTRDTFHAPDDILGAAPRLLHKEATGHMEVLAVDDIPGARPRAADFRTTRQVNPLEPVYPLPHFETAPVPEPPHKRDLWLPDDIAGTKPCAHLPWKPRESLAIDDIAGTRSRPSVRESKGHFDALDVHDINTDGDFKTKRNTNPLSPTYTINGTTVADDATVHSRQPPKARPTPFWPLSTDDIDGAQPMTWERNKVGTLRMENRKGFRDTNTLDDISGAHTGTLRRGLSSSRRVDPNLRDYKLLDGGSVPAEDMLIGRSTANALRSLMARDAALQAATRGSTAPASSPLMPGYSNTAELSASMRSMARKLDPRDAEIVALRAELDHTRRAVAPVPRAEAAVATDAVHSHSDGGNVSATSAPPAESASTRGAAQAPAAVTSRASASDTVESAPLASTAAASAPSSKAPEAAKKSHGRTSSSAAFAATGASQKWSETLGAKMSSGPPADTFKLRQFQRERESEVDAVRRLV